MAQPTGGEFIVNTTTPDSQQDSSVAQLTDGGFVIVWRDGSASTDDPASGAVRLQVYNADGSTRGGERLANTATAGDQYAPKVVSLGYGFVVVWIDNDFSGDFNRYTAQRFEADGDKLGDAFRVGPTRDNGNFREFDLAKVGDGFGVAYVIREPSAGQPRFGIDVSLYDGSGAPTTTVTQANTFSGQAPNQPSLTGQAGGGFVVGWTVNVAGDIGVYARRYGAGGVAAADEFLVNAADSSAQTLSDSALLADGSTVIIFASQAGERATIFAQRFAADGTRIGAPTSISGTLFTSGAAEVAALADGGFAVAFTARETRASADDNIYVREFDATGAAEGDAVVVNATLSGVQNQPGIAALGDGFVVSWTDDSRTGADTDFGSVRAQRFGTAAAGNTPTPGDDQLKGTAGADTIDGLAGGDLIEGFEGDDVLLGGAGNDWLVGGAGSDRLDPGDGVNVLDGGDGLDFADFAGRSVGVWADLAVVAFSDATTWATYLSIEGLIGSSAADALFRDANANTLRGGAGGDALDGRAGADVLEGEAGDDLLRAGDGTDTLRGGAGVDTLSGGAGADLFDLGAACGWDIATDFDGAGGDRIALGAGQTFLFLAVYDANGDGVQDSQLSYAGGTFVALGTSGLDLAGWNALVI